MDYRDIPALAAYVDRVGAEQLNFRRFMIKVHRGAYYIERCVIRLDPDGEIICSNKDYAPTASEAAAIKAAMPGVSFPKCIQATDATVRALIKDEGLDPGGCYSFYDRASGGVVMVQERRTVDGHKAYLPWTYWSDGVWRRMEPDVALPFWKPKAKSNLGRIMIHEGAKTAAFVDALVKDTDACAAHPWGEELKRYEHWGMIGGALAPHRSNYAELVREAPTEVIYVCDNDFPGKSALTAVSKAYAHAMKGIMFDGRWPLAWDLADPMPEALFSAKGRWLGPTLAKLTQLATWATESVPNPTGTGRPLTVLRKGFAEEWVHSVVPEVFVHRDWSQRVLTAQEFNNTVRPFSDVDDTARLLKMDAASKSAVLKYAPALRPGIYSDADGERFVNTHMPGPIRAEKGDVGPFLDFIDRLVVDEADRIELLRWCATLIARPDVKMLYGVLLISEVQGVGKGTLGEKVLAPLVGNPNVSTPSENEIVESNYNYWAAHKRLAIVHEIYAGHSAKAYNKLKSIITDRYITVSKKYQANYEIENWIHLFACSNSMRAIQLSMDDRRWFVPRLTEQKQSAAYWQDLNAWLTDGGGLGIIKHWAEGFLAKHGAVQRGDSAPWSSIKKSIVEEGYSPGMALVSNLLDRISEEYGGEPVVILDQDLVQVIKERIYDGRHSDKLERPATIRKMARSKGWLIGDHPTNWCREWSINGNKVHILTNSEPISKMKVPEIVGVCAPFKVTEMAQRWEGI